MIPDLRNYTLITKVCVYDPGANTETVLIDSGFSNEEYARGVLNMICVRSGDIDHKGNVNDSGHLCAGEQ